LNTDFTFSTEKEYVKSSHERCRAMGINIDMVYSRKIISGEELQKKLEENTELIVTASPFMDQLYSFVKGSGFFAILTDGEGCILNVIGDEDILDTAYRFKMIPGAYMDETSIGTNAMGTSIAEGIPLQISGKEHYIGAYHRWTCSGAPIRNTKNEIIGSLDLTGYSENVHLHTLGMVVAAAYAIEKMLEIKEYAQELFVTKKHMTTIFNSLEGGIITTDLSGNIKAINKLAIDMLGYGEIELKKMKIWDLYEEWQEALLKLHSSEAWYNEDVYINTIKGRVQYNLSAYPIYNKDETIVEVVFIFSEVKRMRKLAGRMIGGQAVYTFDKIIGKNERFVKTLEYAIKIADSKSTILITGESGTGKEVFAQSIHNFSSRKDEPFITLNCGAIPRELMEAELFGYEEGALGGGKKGGYAGKFELADGGTIFLKEVDKLSQDIQLKLLKVIEEGVISRIGSSRKISIDVRIIAATNSDLSCEVENGDFRKDLFYRLNVLPLFLPPLRKRKDDIKIFADHFMKTIAKRLNKKVVNIPTDYMKYLESYDWPGNIRELENVIELIINTESFPKNLGSRKYQYNEISCNNDMDSYNLETIEKNCIIRALKDFDGNISLTARALGIGRSTLYRKLKKYGINY
jgi:PAS domain S-box-containing protein